MLLSGGSPACPFATPLVVISDQKPGNTHFRCETNEHLELESNNVGTI